MAEIDPWELCRRRYLRMAPSNEVVLALGISGSWSDPLLLADLESQKKLLNYIIRNPISTRFPPSPQYVSRILKMVLDALGSKYEVLEELMELYFEISTTKPTSDGSIRELIHKSWLLSRNGENEDFVTIRMASQLDTVGLTSWQAGYMLAEYISANTEIFQDKKCLELGSGVGLTGIVLAKMGRPSHLCLTDYTSEILSNMKSNCTINGLPDIDIKQLDWENFVDPSIDPSASISFTPDVILAADCVYDTSLVQNLCKVLKYFLSRHNDTPPVAIIATTLRNPKTFQYFMEQLTENSLNHEDITASSTFNDIFDEPREGIILSRITFNFGSNNCT